MKKKLMSAGPVIVKSSLIGDKENRLLKIPPVATTPLALC